MQLQFLLETTPEREIRVAQDRAAIGRTQRARHRDIRVDGRLRLAPLFVQARQRAIHGDDLRWARANTTRRLKLTMPGPMTIVDTMPSTGPGSTG